MKAKVFLLLIVLSLSGLSTKAQISMEECIQAALGSHPALKNKDPIEQINSLELENNKLSLYPQLSVSGQGKYQSDVVEFDFDLPFEGISFPEVPHFQYNMSLNANQLIYDGGKRKLQQDLIIIENKERLAGVDVISRSIKQNVQELYLGILLKEKQLEVLNLVDETLKANSDKLLAGIEGGVLLEMDLKLLEAERIDVGRKVLMLREARNGLIDQLALFCNLDLGYEYSFSVPEVSLRVGEPDRYEYEIFSYKNQALEVKKEMTGLKRQPRVSAFGQAGYGRPGLNFMSDKWQDFYVLGLQFSWIPWDYGEAKRKKSSLELSQKILGHEKENFDLQLSAASESILNRIMMFEKLITQDEKMLEIRQSISKTMEKKLNEGIITSAEYISELNREKQARLDLEKSKLDLLANKLAYQVITNK